MLSPFALLLGAAVILVFLGSTWPDFSLLVSVGFADISWVVNSLLPSIVYGLGEEPGWRGFALPRLQKNRSALFATAILYVFWGFWHLPFFFYRYNMTPIAILLFAISLFFGTIWLTFLFNSTGGSILMVIIWHMLWNFVDMITSIVSFALVPFMYLIFWTMVIIIVIIWKPGKLSTRNKHTGDSELEGDDGDSLERKRRENI